jgi:Flp pilus assembly pilin Flp
MTKLYVTALNYAKRLFTRKEEGAAMTEYGLLIVGIALVAFIGAQALGTALSTLYGTTIVGKL